MSPEHDAHEPYDEVPRGGARAARGPGSEGRWEATFDTAPVGMALLDPDGHFMRCNRKLSAMLSRQESELVGRRLSELSGPGAGALLTDEVASKPVDVDFFDRDGGTLATQVTVFPIHDDDGRVVEFVAHVEDVQATVEASLHDPLTGLQNRLLFVDRLTHALARSERILGPVAVLFVNLDHFKSINEKYGHAQGDAVLKATAAKLQSVVRPSDTVARMGGDEFAVLCEDMKGEAGAVVVAERLCTALQEPIPLEPEPLVISASIGIAFAQEGDDPDKLMRNADAAMYRVKEGGRGTYEIYLDAL
jgi:diguanylate cyclase (GGDEF)-like protein/PAS domain S-box-containing protein